MTPFTGNVSDSIPSSGRTPIRLPRFGLGTAALGGLYEAVDHGVAIAVVERAWERGIRYFDTAPLYGYGLAERRLAAALASRPRGDYIISTKVGRLVRNDAPRDPSQFHAGRPFYQRGDEIGTIFDFSRDGIHRSLEESFGRLSTEYVDLAFIHDPEHHFADACLQTAPTLRELRSAGTIRAFGVGMNQCKMLTRFAQTVELDCFLLAGRFSLLDQSAQIAFLPLCFQRKIPVIVGGVFNSGILADPDHAPRYDYIPAAPSTISRARTLRRVCELHGVPLPAAAIQFPLRHPAVTTVLLSARSVRELEENLDLASVKIPADLWAELEEQQLISGAGGDHAH